MKTTVTLLFLLIYNLSFSQECTFLDKQKIDEISGFPVLTQDDGFPVAQNLKLFFRTNKCWTQLIAEFTRGGYSSDVAFNSKTPMIIYFSDATSLILQPTNDYRLASSTSFSVASPLTIAASSRTDVAIYIISIGNVELLATKKVERIKICYTLSFIGEPIPDSNKIVVQYKELKLNGYGSHRIKKISTCMLSVTYFTDEICNNAPQKPVNEEIPKSEDELILEKIASGVKLTESIYKSIDEVNIGDVVTYKSTFEESVFGIVTEKKGSGKLKIKSYPGPKTPIFVDENFKKVNKVEIAK